jgi:hypothetical protein
MELEAQAATQVTQDLTYMSQPISLCNLVALQPLTTELSVPRNFLAVIISTPAPQLVKHLFDSPILLALLIMVIVVLSWRR